MGAANAYLLLYNVAQSVCWAVALVQTVLAIARDGSFGNVYSAAGSTVSEPHAHRNAHAPMSCWTVYSCLLVSLVSYS
jgi:hypothetical protein